VRVGGSNRGRTTSRYRIRRTSWTKTRWTSSARRRSGLAQARESQVSRKSPLERLGEIRGFSRPLMCMGWRRSVVEHSGPADSARLRSMLDESAVDIGIVLCSRHRVSIQLVPSSVSYMHFLASGRASRDGWQTVLVQYDGDPKRKVTVLAACAGAGFTCQ
jgi:hypothetical protein